MKVTISSHRYDLSMISREDIDDKLGNSRMSTGSIKIQADMSPDATCSTILHEIIHQIACIHDLKLDDSEHQVSTLATAILEVLRENQALCYYLTHPDSGLSPIILKVYKKDEYDDGENIV